MITLALKLPEMEKARDGGGAQGESQCGRQGGVGTQKVRRNQSLLIS